MPHYAHQMLDVTREQKATRHELRGMLLCGPQGWVELDHDDMRPSPPISSSGEGEDGESCDSENPREEMSNDYFTRLKDSRVRGLGFRV
jgi:hypothetical protein